jgi:hypothetical protein
MEMSDQLNVPEVAWRKISLPLPGFQPRTVERVAKSGTEFLRKKKLNIKEEAANRTMLRRNSKAMFINVGGYTHNVQRVLKL